MTAKTWALALSVSGSLGLAGAATAAGEFEACGEYGCLHGKLERSERYADESWDETTGADARNWAPDRLVDYLHMKLEMRFDDLEVPRFTAVETLRVSPIGAPVTSLRLDAVGLDVESVRLAGTPVEHFVDDESITLRFEPTLEPGREYEIVFAYACERPYDGLFFSPSSEHVPGYSAEVHTQGQAITNRHWFIMHDAPNERLTTELIVDVPAEYMVSSNGRLVSQLANGGRAIWHWLQDDPHVPYLVTLVIGKFDVVEIPHDRVPMKVWVPEGLGDQVLPTYGRTAEMIGLFEERFGVPYPWDRYDQLVVKNFGAGGMENTTATTMYPSAIFDEAGLRDGDMDSLIAHELAHQWAGDLLTCKDWAHLWLNEGFATYGSALWFEYRDGPDGYLDSMRRAFARVAARDRTTNELGMVSPIYAHPGETFRRAANPYPKGSSILHMLRRMLGEELFWKGMHVYMNRHAFGVVETSDFRYAMEEVSGRGLEWFFVQWCERPGVPHLDVTVAYDAGRRSLLVDVEQTQEIDARTPAFRFTLPVHVQTATGRDRFEIEVTERETAFRADLAGAPLVVEIDPDLHVLGRIDVEKPQKMWLAQLRNGSTIVARHRAVDAIGETETPEHRARLVALAATGTEHHELRNAAVSELRRYGSDDTRAELRTLLANGIEDPRVRARVVAAVVAGVSEAPTDDPVRQEVIARLAELAGADPSYDTRVEAIEGLATLEASDHADLIVELVGFRSQHEKVRQAALGALADLDDERGLELALEYAAYGHMDRARPAAIRAVGDLAHHDHDRAVTALLGMLDDPQSRPARTIGATLADLGDERALEPLEAMARTHPDPDRRDDAEGWVETLREKIKEKRASEDAEG